MSQQSETQQSSSLKRDHLLLFTKHPVPGFAKTRLISSQGPRGAAEISQRLTEHTVTTVRKLKLLHSTLCTYIYFANPGKVPPTATEVWLRPNDDEVLLPQVHGSLGDRLISAFSQAFDKGATKVVVIGTDTPNLTADILQAAYNALDSVDVVIGPALDGGYYLLGMKKMYPTLFKNIPWSTASVCADTVAAALELQLTVKKLQQLRDIDDLDDLLHLPTSEWYVSKAGTFGDP